MADRPSDLRLRISLESADFDTTHIVVRRVEGREAISQPFWYDIDIVVASPEGLDGDAVLGADASLVLERDGLDTRTVHGTISSFVDPLDAETPARSYRLRLVPRLHRLTLIDTQEVFLGLSVPAVIQQKLAQVGLGGGDVELRLVEKYLPREIIVQYRETDLAFISRLAEHIGISYFFDHEPGVDKLVFTDHGTGFARLERLPTMAYRGRGDRTDVFRLDDERHIFPASYAVIDYDYRVPHIELTSTHEHAAGYAGGVAEYGSHHKTPADGERLARMRAEESHARHRFFRGESDLVQLTAGAVVKLTDHPRLDEPYLLIVEVEHHATQVVGTHGGDGGEGYTNTFKAVDASHVYRPPRVTPRPRIHGVLTAVTEAAPSGGSRNMAQIDQDGRYTVKFFFDTAGERQRSSAPVRMAQPHAGPDYGVHFPLKPGVEVTVSFVDGDPDRPIISGSVPNPATTSPVTGRDANMNRIKTVSGSIIEFKDR